MQIRDNLPNIITTGGDVLAPMSKEHIARQKLFAAYWSYYKGNHRRPIKVREGQADDNVIENWSKKIVNHGVNFLFGKGVTFQTDDNPDRNRSEQYLDAFWKDDPGRNFFPGLFLMQLAQNGAVTGTPVVRIYPPKPGDALPYVRAIDPAIVEIITNPDDVEHVTGYHLIWKSGDAWRRHRIEEDASGLMWMIFAETHNGRNWILEDETAWEYDFAPVMHTQNLIVANEAYGASDLQDADLNDAINAIASNNNRIVRFHAHPKTIGTGFQANQLVQTAVDQFWTIPGEGAKVYNLEMQSELAASYQHLRNIEEAFHQIADIPRLDPAQINLGALSGFALRILYGPLLDKTSHKRQTYGSLLMRLNRALLILGGLPDEPVSNIWPYPLPVDPLQRAQEFQALTSIPGVDVYEAALVAGYDEPTARRMTSGGDRLLVPDTPSGPETLV